MLNKTCSFSHSSAPVELSVFCSSTVPAPPEPSQALIPDLHITHRDLEGAVGNVLSSETHADDVLAGLRRRVEDVKCPILVFHHVHVQLRPLGRAHAARHLSFSSSLGVDRNDRLLADLDSWADASAFVTNKNDAVTLQQLRDELGLQTRSMHIPQPGGFVKVNLIMLFQPTVNCYQ